MKIFYSTSFDSAKLPLPSRYQRHHNVTYRYRILSKVTHGSSTLHIVTHRNSSLHTVISPLLTVTDRYTSIPHRYLNVTVTSTLPLPQCYHYLNVTITSPLPYRHLTVTLPSPIT